MTARFDVEGRLAEGRPAVEDTQTYVQACHLLGYQHPDLTAHGSQVRDWYETEAGLDLRVLDDDSAELRAAVNTVDEAQWLQRMQVTEIAAAWTGSGADSAARFLQRHCDAAAQLAARVRAAADGYAMLRDNLWQMIDGKAATATAIDDRRLGERSAWLAAAHTVTTGASDRSAAEELVRQHVTPYVDNDIRGDWLAGMRAATASAQASYDAAIDTLSSVRQVCFEIPGELGPSWQPVLDEPLGPSLATAALPEMSTPADVAPTVPAAVSAPPSIPEPPQALSTGTLDDLPSVPPELAAPLGDTAGLSTGAGNLGGLAGGIGGVVGKIVDGIGGLLGSLANGFGDPSGSGDPLLDDPLDADDLLADDADDPATDSADDTPDVEADDAKPAGVNEDGSDEAPAETPPVDEPAAQQVASPPAAGIGGPPPDAPPPPASGPQPDGSTPCEIAADELPQVGQ
jgi:hypothetical protein